MKTIQLAITEEKDDILGFIEKLTAKNKELTCIVLLTGNKKDIPELSEYLIKDKADNKRKVKHELNRLLFSMRMRDLKGVSYLKESIIQTVYEPDLLNGITKLLYPEVAKKFDVRVQNVERDIRKAIENVWCKGNQSILLQLFGYNRESGMGKPTNSEFIAVITDYIRRNIGIKTQ